MKLTDEQLMELDIPTKPSNRAEVDAFNYICASLSDYEFVEEAMQKRLRLIPNGWREFRMLNSRMEQLSKKILLTFEPKKRAQIARTARSIRHKLVFGKGVVQEKDVFVIDSDSLGILIQAAVDNCRFRMCAPSECNQCILAKALDSYSFVSRGSRAWWEVFNTASNGGTDDEIAGEGL